MNILVPAIILLMAQSALASQKQFCEPSVPTETRASLSDYQDFFDAFKIRVVSPGVDLRNIEAFRLELEKFPKSLMAEMLEAGATIHVINGKSVMDDPTWNKNLTKASNDRIWSNIVGAGGHPYMNNQTNIYNKSMQKKAQEWGEYCNKVVCNQQQKSLVEPTLLGSVYPTRFVLNLMYNENSRAATGIIEERPENVDINKFYNAGVVHHGSANLFLHEHGHALDSIYSNLGISTSPAWKELMEQEEFRTIMWSVNSTVGFKNSTESFAELFAYYHACDATRGHMETEAPQIASYFKNLTRVKAPGKEVEVDKSPVDMTIFELPEDIKEKAAKEDARLSSPAPIVPMVIRYQKPAVKEVKASKRFKAPDLEKVGESIEGTAKKVGSFFSKNFKSIRRRMDKKD